MITRLCISNYRSIGGGLDLRLGPLTVLVGPNGSGKSNIVDVLRFLHECVDTSLPQAVAARHGFGAISRWSPGKPHAIDVAVEIQPFNGETWFWGFTLGAGKREDEFMVQREFAHARGHAVASMARRPRLALDDFLRARRADDLRPELFDVVDRELHAFYRGPRGWEHPRDHVVSQEMTDLALPFSDKMSEGLGAIKHEVSSIAIYSLFPNTLRAAQMPNPVKPMMTTGENWASTLKALGKKEWGAELCAALRRITGDIDDYRVLHAGGYVIPEFRHGTDGNGKGIWRGAAQESDGTLRVAAMLTALLQQPAPALIGFEEPELAVHPGALPVLFDFLVEASRRRQIILTTHSPELMDLFDIEDIRVVQRTGGVTTVSRVEERQRELVRRRLLSTSELLRAEGLRPEGSPE